MNNWTNDFLTRCLEGIPKGNYRDRVEKELRDHMETQYQVLTEAGASPQEAQSRVLNTIGDPEQLRKEYVASWARTLQGRWALRPNLAFPMLGVCLITGHLYVFTVIILEEIGFSRNSGPLFLGNPLIEFIYCCAMYFVPTVLGALFLRFCFRKTDRPVPWITLGLLTSWTGEKVCLFLLAAFFQYANRHKREMTFLAIMRRVPWCPGDYAYAWQGVLYVFASFAGCLALGWLFGHRNERSCKLV